jgi:hypothetical protein
MVSFMDWITPDSPSDFGAILFWVLIVILVSIIIIDIYAYLSYRKTPKKIETPHQNLDPREETKKSKDRSQDLVDIRNKVDKLIEMNKL